MQAKVSEQGRVTIPKRLRDELDIGPGTVLDFELDGERIIAVKRVPGDPFAAAFGSLTLPGTTDQLISELRTA